VIGSMGKYGRGGRLIGNISGIVWRRLGVGWGPCDLPIKRKRRTTTAPGPPPGGSRTAHGRRSRSGAWLKCRFCLDTRTRRLRLAVSGRQRLMHTHQLGCTSRRIGSMLIAPVFKTYSKSTRKQTLKPERVQLQTYFLGGCYRQNQNRLKFQAPRKRSQGIIYHFRASDCIFGIS
jgi:hypothetical protein